MDPQDGRQRPQPTWWFAYAVFGPIVLFTVALGWYCGYRRERKQLKRLNDPNYLPSYIETIRLGGRTNRLITQPGGTEAGAGTENGEAGETEPAPPGYTADEIVANNEHIPVWMITDPEGGRVVDGAVDVPSCEGSVGVDAAATADGVVVDHAVGQGDERNEGDRGVARRPSTPVLRSHSPSPSTSTSFKAYAIASASAAPSPTIPPPPSYEASTPSPPPLPSPSPSPNTTSRSDE
ncbi:hypothetical protein HK104_000152 [Borealophlyctis nickersoniae]|nr:hypothetical protein HK104_000152 [Borealophlyctis nickersoniae]